MMSSLHKLLVKGTAAVAAVTLALSLAAADSASLRAHSAAASGAVLSQWRGAVADVDLAGGDSIDSIYGTHGSFNVTRPLHESWFNQYRSLASGVFFSAFNEALVTEYLQSSLRDELILGTGRADVSEWLRTQGREVHRRLLTDTADFITNAFTREGERRVRGLNFVRNIDVLYQSNLGDRQSNFALAASGVLQETDIDLLGWEGRAYATEQSDAGANLGGIYRFNFSDRLLLGGNVFLDYENTDNYGEFWRWSVGAEALSHFLNLHANYYIGVTDDKRIVEGDEEFILGSADGWDVELSGQLPDIPWAQVGLRYYVWEGMGDDEDHRGLRYRLELTPLDQLRLGVEYEASENGDNDFGYYADWHVVLPEAKRSLAWSGAPIAAESMWNYRYAPVRREHKQRIIRESKDPVASDIEMLVVIAGGSYTHGVQTSTFASGGEYTLPATATVGIATGSDSDTSTDSVAVSLSRQGSYILNIFEDTQLAYLGADNIARITAGQIRYRSTGANSGRLATIQVNPNTGQTPMNIALDGTGLRVRVDEPLSGNDPHTVIVTPEEDTIHFTNLHELSNITLVLEFTANISNQARAPQVLITRSDGRTLSVSQEQDGVTNVLALAENSPGSDGILYIDENRTYDFAELQIGGGFENNEVTFSIEGSHPNISTTERGVLRAANISGETAVTIAIAAAYGLRGLHTIRIVPLADISTTPAHNSNIPIYSQYAYDFLTVNISGDLPPYEVSLNGSGINTSGDFDIRRGNSDSQYILRTRRINQTPNENQPLNIKITGREGRSADIAYNLFPVTPAVTIVDSELVAIVNLDQPIGSFAAAVSGGKPPYTYAITDNAPNPYQVQFVGNDNTSPNLEFTTTPQNTNTVQVGMRVTDAIGNRSDANITIAILDRLGLARTQFYALDSGTQTFATLTAIGAGSGGVYSITEVNSHSNISFTGTPTSNTRELQISGSRTAGTPLSYVVNVDHDTSPLDAEDVTLSIDIVSPVAVQNASNIPNPLVVYNNVEAEAVLSVTLAGGAEAYTPNIVSGGGNFTTQNGSANNEIILRANNRVTHTDGGLVVIEFNAEDNLSTATVTITLQATPEVSVADQFFDAVRNQQNLIGGGAVIATDGRGAASYVWNIISDSTAYPMEFIPNTNQLRFETAPTTAGEATITIQVSDTSNTDNAVIIITIYDSISLQQDTFFVLDTGTYTFATLNAIGAGSGGVYTFTDTPNANIRFTGTAGSDTQPLEIYGSRTAGSDLTFDLQIADARPTPILPPADLQITASVVSALAINNYTAAPLQVYNEVASENVLTISLSGGAGNITPAALTGSGAGNFDINQNGSTRTEFILRANDRVTHNSGDEVAMEFSSFDNLSTATLSITLAANPAISIPAQSYNGKLNDTALIGDDTLAASGGRGSRTWTIISNDSSNPVDIINGNQLQFRTAPSGEGEAVIEVQVTDDDNTATAIITITILNRISLQEDSFYALNSGNYIFATIVAQGAEANATYTFDEASAHPNLSTDGAVQNNNSQPLRIQGTRAAGDILTLTLNIDTDTLPLEPVEVEVTIVAPVAFSNTGNRPDPIVVYNNTPAEDVLTLTLQGGAGAYTHNTTSGSGVLNISQGSGAAANQFTFTAPRATHTDGDEMVVEFSAADNVSTLTTTLTLSAIPQISMADADGNTYFAVADSTANFLTLAATDGKPPQNGYTYRIVSSTPNSAAEISDAGELNFTTAETTERDIVLEVEASDGINTATATITIRVVRSLRLSNINTTEPLFYLLAANNTQNIATLTVRGGNPANFQLTQSDTAPYQLRINNPSTDDGLYILQASGNRTAGTNSEIVLEIWDTANTALDTLTLTIDVNVIAQLGLSNQNVNRILRQGTDENANIVTFAPSGGATPYTFAIADAEPNNWRNLVALSNASDSANSILQDNGGVANGSGGDGVTLTIAISDSSQNIGSSTPLTTPISAVVVLTVAEQLAFDANDDVQITLRPADDGAVIYTPNVSGGTAPLAYSIASTDPSSWASPTPAARYNLNTSNGVLTEAALLNERGGIADGAQGTLNLRVTDADTSNGRSAQTDSLALSIHVIAPFTLTNAADLAQTITLRPDDANSEITRIASGGGILPHAYELISTNPASWQSLVSFNASNGALTDSTLIDTPQQGQRGSVHIRATDADTANNNGRNGAPNRLTLTLELLVDNPLSFTTPPPDAIALLTLRTGVHENTQVLDFDHVGGTDPIQYAIHNITPASYASQFNFNTNNGVLTDNGAVATPPAGGFVTLVIRVTDNASPSQSANATLHLRILPELRFNSNVETSVTFDRQTHAGSQIIDISNGASGGEGNITYALDRTVPAALANKLSFNANTGILTDNGAITDNEDGLIIFTATDSADTPLAVEHTLTMVVTDDTRFIPPQLTVNYGCCNNAGQFIITLTLRGGDFSSGSGDPDYEILSTDPAGILSSNLIAIWQTDINQRRRDFRIIDTGLLPLIDQNIKEDFNFTMVVRAADRAGIAATLTAAMLYSFPPLVSVVGAEHISDTEDDRDVAYEFRFTITQDQFSTGNYVTLSVTNIRNEASNNIIFIRNSGGFTRIGGAGNQWSEGAEYRLRLRRTPDSQHSNDDFAQDRNRDGFHEILVGNRGDNPDLPQNSFIRWVYNSLEGNNGDTPNTEDQNANRNDGSLTLRAEIQPSGESSRITLFLRPYVANRLHWEGGSNNSNGNAPVATINYTYGDATPTNLYTLRLKSEALFQGEGTKTYALVSTNPASFAASVSFAEDTNTAGDWVISQVNSNGFGSYTEGAVSLVYRVQDAAGQQAIASLVVSVAVPELDFDASSQRSGRTPIAVERMRVTLTLDATNSGVPPYTWSVGTHDTTEYDTHTQISQDTAPREAVVTFTPSSFPRSTPLPNTALLRYQVTDALGRQAVATVDLTIRTLDFDDASKQTRQLTAFSASNPSNSLNHTVLVAPLTRGLAPFVWEEISANNGQWAGHNSITQSPTNDRAGVIRAANLPPTGAALPRRQQLSYKVTDAFGQVATVQNAVSMFIRPFSTRSVSRATLTVTIAAATDANDALFTISINTANNSGLWPHRASVDISPAEWQGRQFPIGFENNQFLDWVLRVPADIFAGGYPISQVTMDYYLYDSRGGFDNQPFRLVATLTFPALRFATAQQRFTHNLLPQDNMNHANSQAIVTLRSNNSAPGTSSGYVYTIDDETPATLRALTQIASTIVVGGRDAAVIVDNGLYDALDHTNGATVFYRLTDSAGTSTRSTVIYSFSTPLMHWRNPAAAVPTAANDTVFNLTLRETRQGKTPYTYTILGAEPATESGNDIAAQFSIDDNGMLTDDGYAALGLDLSPVLTIQVRDALGNTDQVDLQLNGPLRFNSDIVTLTVGWHHNGNNIIVSPHINLASGGNGYNRYVAEFSASDPAGVLASNLVQEFNGDAIADNGLATLLAPGEAATLTYEAYDTLETPPNTVTMSIVFERQEYLYLAGGHWGVDNRTDVWASQDGSNWTQLNTSINNFFGRANPAGTFLNGTLFYSGGRENSPQSSSYSDDVVYTDNTYTFLRHTDRGFSGREDHVMTSANNTLYIYGGSNNNATFRDIWVSADGSGQTWTRATLNVDWSGDGTTTPLEDKSYGIAFQGSLFYLPTSADASFNNSGIQAAPLDDLSNWSVVNADPFGYVASGTPNSRWFRYTVAKHNGTLYMMGGRISEPNETDTNDRPQTAVWASADGTTWTKKTDVSFGDNISNFSQGRLAAANGSLYYASFGGPTQHGMWRSDDGGTNWTYIENPYPFTEGRAAPLFLSQ